MKLNLDERLQKQTKTTVLIVDENIKDQEFLMSTLNKNNYSFICSNRIEEGLKTLIDNKEIISLVILDLSSNSKEGLKFLEEKGNNIDIKDVPIVVVTNKKNLEVKCLSLGASHFILKPFESKKVVKARIENVLSLHMKNMIISKTREDEVTGLLNTDFFIHT